MPAAFILSLAQLGDPALLRVLWRALLLTLAVFALLAWAIMATVAHIETTGWPDWLRAVWTGGGGGIAGFLLSGLLLWLGFAGVATGAATLWQDEIIAAVEARYYPAARGFPLGLSREIALGLGAGLRVLLWNALFLPVYLLLLVTGIGPLILFVAVNAWLIGREYLEMVAARHLPMAAAAAWPATHRWDRWGTGLVTAGLFALPVLGIVAPLVGVAFATHMYHRRAA